MTDNKIISSLTDEELLEAYWRASELKHPTLADELRAVADIAAKRAIDDFLYQSKKIRWVD
jgi:hypothetical protein